MVRKQSTEPRGIFSPTGWKAWHFSVLRIVPDEGKPYLARLQSVANGVATLHALTEKDATLKDVAAVVTMCWPPSDATVTVMRTPV
jgi:hypothetical protein